jgi:hypothetical protein
MGIDCIFRELKENPFATNDKDKIKPRYFKYSVGGRISRVTLPLPPVEYWNEYMRLRREFKEKVDNQATEEMESINYKKELKVSNEQQRRDKRNEKRNHYLINSQL